MYIANGTIKDVVIIQLQKDEDVMSSIKRVCEEKGIKNGVILSVAGSVNGAYYSNPIPDPTSLSEEHGSYIATYGPLEVLGACGEICHLDDGEVVVHMHMTLSDKDGHAFGGHVEKVGMRVLCTLNVVIGVLEGVDMGFIHDARIEKNILCPKNII